MQQKEKKQFCSILFQTFAHSTIVVNPQLNNTHNCDNKGKTTRTIKLEQQELTAYNAEVLLITCNQISVVVIFLVTTTTTTTINNNNISDNF